MSALDVEQHGWTAEYPHAATFVKNAFPIDPLPKPALPQAKLVDEASLGRKIAEAVAERNAFWQMHERAQIEFMKEETGKLMGKMSQEMQRLHLVNRELGRRVHVEGGKPSEEIDQLKRDLSAERRASADLRRELGLAVKRSARLAKMLERTGNAHKEQMAQYEARMADHQEQIRRLNGLLLAKVKSRSIGPTMVRFGPLRRSQSGDERAPEGRIRSRSEMLSGNGNRGQKQQLGIDATPVRVGRDQLNRATLRMMHSGKGNSRAAGEEGK